MTSLPASVNHRSHLAQANGISGTPLVPTEHAFTRLTAREVTALVEAHRVSHELALRRGSLAMSVHLGLIAIRAASRRIHGAVINAMLITQPQTGQPISCFAPATSAALVSQRHVKQVLLQLHNELVLLKKLISLELLHIQFFLIGVRHANLRSPHVY